MHWLTFVMVLSTSFRKERYSSTVIMVPKNGVLLGKDESHGIKLVVQPRFRSNGVVTVESTCTQSCSHSMSIPFAQFWNRWSREIVKSFSGNTGLFVSRKESVLSSANRRRTDGGDYLATNSGKRLTQTLNKRGARILDGRSKDATLRHSLLDRPKQTWRDR